MNLGKPLAERKRSDNHLIIEKFVKPEAIPTSGPQARKFWMLEMKFCARLVKTYGADFLLWVTIPYQMDSLLAFSGAWGKEIFTKQLPAYKQIKTDLTTKVEKVELEDDKIGEDVVVSKKPKTLNDFLNLFN